MSLLEYGFESPRKISMVEMYQNHFDEHNIVDRYDRALHVFRERNFVSTADLKLLFGDLLNGVIIGLRRGSRRGVCYAIISAVERDINGDLVVGYKLEETK